MDSQKHAELLTANYALNRSMLQVQSSKTDCRLAELEMRIAQEECRLSALRCQQAIVKNRLQLSLSSNKTMKTSLLNLPVSLEINLPEPLFRRLQTRLDGHPQESIDSLFAHAVALYLAQTEGK